MIKFFNTFLLLLLLTSSSQCGWKWKNPSLTGNSLNCLIKFDDENIFFAGDAGTIIHFDGKNWKFMFSNIGANLNAICGNSPSDIFVTGQDILNSEGIIQHYNGKIWRTQISISGVFRDIFKSSSKMLAAGFDFERKVGIIYEYKNSEWKEFHIFENFYPISLWLCENFIFVAGMTLSDMGVISYYDGVKWNKLVFDQIVYFKKIFGFSENDVFALGYNNAQKCDVLYHFNGKEWYVFCTFESTYSLHSIWGISSSDFYLIGRNSNNQGMVLHFNGNNWQEEAVFNNISLYNIYGTSNDDIYAVGSGGSIIHYNGNKWENLTDALRTNFLSIWGRSENSFFISGYDIVENKGRIYKFNGEDLQLQYETDGMIFQNLFGFSESEIFAAGVDEETEKGKIYYFDGNKWTLIYTTEKPFNLLKLWSNESSNLYFVGEEYTTPETSYAKIYHYNGKNWEISFSLNVPGSIFNSIYGFSSSDIYAVGGTFNIGGSTGFIYHYDGEKWKSELSLHGFTFTDIWATSPDNIYIVGHNNTRSTGIIYHYNGENWNLIYETPLTDGEVFFKKIYGFSENDIYIIGLVNAKSVVYHYNGKSWNKIPQIFSPDFYEIIGFSNKNLYLVGSDGAILYFDGNSLIEEGENQFENVNLKIKTSLSIPVNSQQLYEEFNIPSYFIPITDILNFVSNINPAGATGIFKFDIYGMNLSISSLLLYKLIPNENPLKFDYAPSPNILENGKWWMTDTNGNYLNSKQILIEGKKYSVYFVVKDNDENGFDLNTKSGILVDPIVLGSLNIGENGNCFIATATYGSPISREILVLKSFRDKYLKKNKIGRLFVKFYYKISPPIAKFIRRHVCFKKLVRIGLEPVVWFCEKILKNKEG